MSRLLLLLLLCLSLSPSSLVWGAEHTITTTGTYIMEEGENPLVARSKALENAKLQAIEQACVYITSSTTVQNMHLDKDLIQTLAAGNIKTSILEEKSQLLPDNKTLFTIHASCQITILDQDSLQKRIQSIQLDSSYKILAAEHAALQTQSEQLKKSLATNKSKEERDKILLLIAKNETDYLSLLALEQGRNLYLAGEYQAAVTYLDNIIQQNTPHFSAFSYRAAAYAALGRYDQALSDIDFAIALKPDLADNYGIKGHIYDKQGDFTQAIAAYDRAIAIDPKLKLLYLLRGQAYEKQKLYKEAITGYDQALTILPNNSELYARRASCYMFLQEDSKALPDLNKAIQLNPSNDNAYSLRGLLYYSARNYSLALDDFNKALALKPNSTIFHKRGDLYTSNGKYQLAADSYSSALNLDDKYYNSYIGRAHALARLAKFEAALEDCNKALSLQPANDTGYISRGSVYLSLAQHDLTPKDLAQTLHHLALNDFAQALQLNPHNSNLRDFVQQLKQKKI